MKLKWHSALCWHNTNGPSAMDRRPESVTSAFGFMLKHGADCRGEEMLELKRHYYIKDHYGNTEQILKSDSEQLLMHWNAQFHSINDVLHNSRSQFCCPLCCYTLGKCRGSCHGSLWKTNIFFTRLHFFTSYKLYSSPGFTFARYSLSCWET